MQKGYGLAYMADGGKVPGHGSGDKVHAMLDPREVVMPPDTVKKIGAKHLLAMIDATHKPTGKPPVKGGKRMMADGGLVDEDPRKRLAAPPALVLPGVSATLAGSGQDASTAFDQGNYGAAAGHVLRGAATLPLALADDVVGRPLREVGAPVARGVANAAFTALTGNNAIPSATAATPPATPPAIPAAAGVPTPRRESSLPVANAVSADPQVTTLLPTPSAQARLGAQPQVDAPGTIVKTPINPDGTRGTPQRFGAGRSAANDGNNVTERLALPDGRVVDAAKYQQEQTNAAAALAADPIARQQAYEQEKFARNEAIARQGGSKGYAQRLAMLNSSSGNQNVAATAQQAPLTQAQAGHANAQTQALATGTAQAKRLDTLQQQYLSETDPVKQAALGARIRTLQGKDKPEPDVFDRVQTGVDPVTQAPIFSIYSKRTGLVADRPAGAQKLPPGMTRQVGTSGGKPVYEDKDGKRYVGG